MSKAENSLRKYFYSLATDERKGFWASIFKFFLLLASFIYGLGIRFILLGYKIGVARSRRLNCKVISIGNITWGGTGKTTLIQMLARRLLADGRRPAVLIRGYGMGDESYLLSKALAGIPVLVGRNRIECGRRAINEYSADTILLDDGFQHWRLDRDVDILTINSMDPFGNGNLIPRGILREPIAGLNRADLFFLTKTDLVKEKTLTGIKEKLRRLRPNASMVESIHKPVYLYSPAKGEMVGLDAIQGELVALLSGIGDPNSFQRTVEALGAKIVLNFTYLDHHRYTTQDLKSLVDSCLASDVRTVITTEKDMVSLQDIIGSFQPSTFSFQLRILALHIEIEITKGEEILDGFLSAVFSG